MLPEESLLKTVVNEEIEPSLSWQLDFRTGRVTNRIDELDAVKQAVFKILQTERYEYLIYTFDYGSELRGLIGVNPLFVRSELNRRIEEALLQDDRIIAIENTQVTIEEERLLATFTVVTGLGEFEYEQEVTNGV